MNRRFEYPVRLEEDRDDGGFVATMPDFPEVVTQGNDEAEALAEVEDALGSAIATRMRLREEIPAPSARRRLPRVLVPADVAAKAALYMATRELGLTQAQLGARLKLDAREVRRLLDPGHPSKMPRLESALAILGHAVRIQIVPLPGFAALVAEPARAGKAARSGGSKRIGKVARRGA